MPLGFGRAVGWISRHPKTLVGGAAAAGVIGGNPFRGSGISGAFQEQVLGDPSAFRTLARAQIYQTIHDMVATPGERNGLSYLRSNYSRVPSTSLYGPGGGPSGNIVFGMHQLRIR